MKYIGGVMGLSHVHYQSLLTYGIHLFADLYFECVDIYQVEHILSALNFEEKGKKFFPSS